MISLKLFGGASLEDGGGVLTGPAAQRHRLALLALLAASHPRGLARDRLTAYLWPDRDDAHSRNLLNQAVHALRRTLGEDTIVSAGDELRINAAMVPCDLIDFEVSLAAGDLTRSVGLYVGPLLDGFSLPDSPEFEQWADGERERVRRACCQALESLAEHAAAHGQPAEAVRWWRLLAAQEPYSAHVTLRLMEALAAAGDRAAAIQQARLHTLLIQQEFDAEPDPQVVMLAERLRRGPPVPPASASAAAPGAMAATAPDGDVPSAAPAGAAPMAAGSGSAGRGVSDDVTVPAGDGAADSATTGSAGFATTGPTGSATTGSAGGFRGRVLVAAVAVGVVIAAAWASVSSSLGRPAEVRRIAVLPLANLTGDPQQDYFVAGMHDALVAELAQIEALTVYSRQSVLRYQGSDLPLPAIARELGVDALVEGSVFRGGDSVRITIQLVRARPEQHVWSASYYGPLSHALGLQGEVARAIAGAVRARIEPDVRERLARATLVHPDAQQAYLTGLYHLERAFYGQAAPQSDRLAALDTVIRLLQAAIDLEPDWASAHARLAVAYHWLATAFFWDISRQRAHEDEFFPKSKVAALRALELDPSESQAHAALGFVRFSYEWDWDGADRAFRRALELDPNTHHWGYAMYLQAAGRHDEAIRHLHMAEERHPMSDFLKSSVVSAYVCADRYDEAIAHARELNSRVAASGRTGVVGDSVWLLDFVARQLSLKGDHERAIATAEQLVALTDSVTASAPLALTLSMAGRHDEARAILDWREAQVLSAGQIWAPAHQYAALGETARAIDMVEATLVGRRARTINFRCTLTYKLLRGEPRMQALLRPVGFPN